LRRVGEHGILAWLRQVVDKGIAPRVIRIAMEACGAAATHAADRFAAGSRQYPDVSCRTVPDIARAPGYSDPGSFTHVFERCSGLAARLSLAS